MMRSHRVAATATDPIEVQPVDAMLAFAAIVVVLVILSALGAAFGADSRDGFASEPRPSIYG